MDDVLLGEDENSSFKQNISPKAFLLAKELLPQIDPKLRRQIIRIFGIWKLLGLFTASDASEFIDKSLEEVDAESDEEGDGGQPGDAHFEVGRRDSLVRCREGRSGRSILR